MAKIREGEGQDGENEDEGEDGEDADSEDEDGDDVKKIGTKYLNLQSLEYFAIITI